MIAGLHVLPSLLLACAHQRTASDPHQPANAVLSLRIQVPGLTELFVNKLVSSLDPKGRAALRRLSLAPASAPVFKMPYIRCDGINILLTLDASLVVRARLRLSAKLTRVSSKRLNRLFPPTSLLDESHYLCHVTDIIYHLLTGNWLHRAQARGVLPVEFTVDDALAHVNHVHAYYPVFTVPPQLVVGMLLASFRNAHVMSYYDQLYYAFDVFAYSRPIQQKVLKTTSAILCKTARLPEGQLVPARVLPNLPYLELFYGRSDKTSDLEKEYANRCTTTYYLHTQANSWSTDQWRTDPTAHVVYGANFYNKLRGIMRKCARILLRRHPVKESFSDFLARQAEWIASGSAGGPLSKVADSKSGTVKLSKRGWAEQAARADIVAVLNDQTPQE